MQLLNLNMNRIILPVAALTASAFCASISAPLASWFWNTDMITNSGDVSNILAFAEAVGLTHIYAQIDSTISNADWENFIGNFNASGIIVDALLGDADWVLEAGDLETELQWIEQYQNSASANSKFTGIHMDIEVRAKTSPYLFLLRMPYFYIRTLIHIS
jgi:hypothetical protein